MEDVSVAVVVVAPPTTDAEAPGTTPGGPDIPGPGSRGGLWSGRQV